MFVIVVDAVDIVVVVIVVDGDVFIVVVVVNSEVTVGDRLLSL